MERPLTFIVKINSDSADYLIFLSFYLAVKQIIKTTLQTHYSLNISSYEKTIVNSSLIGIFYI